MARASDADLDRIEDVLTALRALPGVPVTKRGVFYRGREAFVHFHTEDGEIYADARIEPGAGFERLPVGTRGERRRFLAAAALNHEPAKTISLQ